MISLEQCRTILGDDAKVLSNEELRELRDWLYVLAHYLIKADIEYKQ